MKIRITITAIIILQGIFYFCAAQNPEIKFNLVEGNNGEPLGKIGSITQDAKGYMWFAGQDAHCLYRYDGYRIMSFSHDSLNANSLGGIYPETVYVDALGMIWVGFWGTGVDRYDPGTGVFTHYRHKSGDAASLANDTVSVVTKDHKGTLWVGTIKGLDRLDENTGKFIHYRYDPSNPASLSNNVVRAIYEDHKGVLWIGTGFPFYKYYEKPIDGGLNRMDANGNFTRFLHDPANPHSLLNNMVRCIFEDSRGIFWIGTAENGLHTMDREKGSFERHLYNASHPDQLSGPPMKPGLHNDHITFIQEDGTGAIWLGTYFAGISRYDPQAKKITHYDVSNGFPDGSGWQAYTSREGVLWFSTQEANLFRIDPFIKTIPSVNTGGGIAQSFYEDKEGTLWVGTKEKGLLQYDQNRKLIRQFGIEVGKPFGISDANVTSIYEDQRDTLWLSTKSGVKIFNKRSSHFTNFLFNDRQIDSVSREFSNIVRDRHGLMWIATLSGFIRYKPADGSVKLFLPTGKDSGIVNERITYVLNDKDDNIWVAHWLGGGIDRLDKQSEKSTHYLRGLFVRCIYQDSAGDIWAGAKNGLFRFNRDSDNFTPFFDPQREIGASAVYGIVQDDSRNLWISTPSAIVKLNPARTEDIVYGRKFGIQANSISDGEIYKTGKGEILVGNHSGFYAFHPDELTISVKPLQIIITDFFVNSQKQKPGKGRILEKPVEDISEMTLKHNQNSLSFDFAVIDYRAPEANKSFAMLENYDNNWRETSGEKNTFYFNVPPGKYIFRIKAYNSDGIKAEKAVLITINPPWWRSWWAYCLYILLLFIAGIGIYRFQKQRIINIERKKTQVKELAQAKEIEKAYRDLKATQAQLIQSEKMASLGELTAGIAHEIQNPLNFVNNFSEVNSELIDEMEQEIDKGNLDEAKTIAKDIRDNEQKISYHGKRADSIVKGMLQHSRTSNGQKEMTGINALADEYLRLSYHGLRAKDKSFNATIQTNFDESIGEINIIPQDVGRVLLNLCNNAFYAVTEKSAFVKASASAGASVHEPPGEYEPIVLVSTQKTGNEVLISVKDNGNGIPQKVTGKIFQPFFTTKPSGQGTGLGLSLSYDIIKAHGGTLKVETKEGEGSEFIIQLPNKA